jgi:hypothetical protein
MGQREDNKRREDEREGWILNAWAYYYNMCIVKKVIDFPVPSRDRDVTYQTLPAEDGKFHNLFFTVYIVVPYPGHEVRVGNAGLLALYR